MIHQGKVEPAGKFVQLLNKLFSGYSNISVAIRITIVYAILGSLWITFSDKLLITIFDPDTVIEYALLQTFKGWFFILLTSAILFYLIIGNIRKLKKSKELRYQAERRYRTVFENTGTAIAILEDDLTVSLVNGKFSGLSGYNKHDIEGKRTWTTFVEKDDLVKVMEYHRQQKADENEIPPSYEFRMRTAEGQTLDVIATLAFVPETRQTIVSLIDISDRKELEANYLRAQRMESVGTLSGGIAHDLNNILSPILLSIETLRDIVDNEKAQRLLHIMRSSTQRGSDLVSQILSFSRGIYGEHLIIQPRYILTEISQIVRATFPKSIRVQTDIPINLRTLSGNPTQLHQALLNICVNARDAMPEGGTLSIHAENIVIGPDNEGLYTNMRHGSYVSISIADTGTGIPDEIRDKLFSPFFTTKEEGKGTGLGLPTVEFILRNHGGYIKVDSEKNRGSTFTLFFPTSDAPAIEQEQESELLPGGNGACVLLIEDEAAVREMISEILRFHNYEVLIAQDGADGLAKYMRFKDRIDLVLTDSNMPNLGNEQLIKSLYESNPEVKVFITTGSRQVLEDLEHLQPPIVGFLQKPYSTHSLLTQLHRILNP
jgi:two-component system, cell cycle sensor histidine kinase and response regulator CckA